MDSVTAAEKANKHKPKHDRKGEGEGQGGDGKGKKHRHTKKDAEGKTGEGKGAKLGEGLTAKAWFSKPSAAAAKKGTNKSEDSDDESVISVEHAEGSAKADDASIASTSDSAKPLPDGPIYRPDKPKRGSRRKNKDSAPDEPAKQEMENMTVQLVLDQPFSTVEGKEDQYRMGLSLDIARALGDRRLKPRVLALQPGLRTSF